MVNLSILYLAILNRLSVTLLHQTLTNFQEERQKSYKKEKKADRKRKAEGELNLNIDPDMAAVMGFSGFGGSKK